jgi:hypothetical protein
MQLLVQNLEHFSGGQLIERVMGWRNLRGLSRPRLTVLAASLSLALLEG